MSLALNTSSDALDWTQSTDPWQVGSCVQPLTKAAFVDATSQGKDTRTIVTAEGLGTTSASHGSSSVDEMNRRLLAIPGAEWFPHDASLWMGEPLTGAVTGMVAFQQWTTRAIGQNELSRPRVLINSFVQGRGGRWRRDILGVHERLSALLGDAWPSNTQWERLEMQLRGLRDLPADWVGEGRGPSKAVIDAASAFLARARSAGVPAPSEASADGDGEMALRWRIGRRSAAASFLPDGHIVAYVSQGDGGQLFKLDESYSDCLDLSGLIENLRSLS